MLRLSGLLILIMLSVVILGCSSLRFDTNVLEIGERKVRASKVEVYSQQFVFNREYTNVGNVSATYCHDAPLSQQDIKPIPSDDVLIKSLKAQVQSRGGNALVFHQCRRSNSGQCSVFIDCTGTGYSIDV